MWKKEEGQPTQPTSESTTRSQSPPVATSSSEGRATIGPSISIRGDVTGSEDLVIDGQVDGSVSLELHSVSVGPQGRVNANITGRKITVEGHVEGDLTAEEQIVLRGSARVQGDIKAPRVVLEDGATFRGLVDMGSARKDGPKVESAGKAAGEDRGASSRKPAAEPDGNRSASGKTDGAPSAGAGVPAGRKGTDGSDKARQASA